MKRFIVIPTVLLFVTLFASIPFVLNGAPRADLITVPQPPANYWPGMDAPGDIHCERWYEPTYTERFCTGKDGIEVMIHGSTIARTWLFTYGSGLRIGDVIAAWGTPQRADYSGYAVDVYWTDRYAYAVADNRFSPDSRVGFISYGAREMAWGPWRGFKVGK